MKNRLENASMSDIGKIFAENLAELRKQRGWTQDNLAEYAGLSLPGIQGLESQRRWPTRETIAKLAEALEVTEERLFKPANISAPTIHEALLTIVSHFGYDLKKNKRKN